MGNPSTNLFLENGSWIVSLLVAGCSSDRKLVSEKGPGKEEDATEEAASSA
jgi:hypothetical protein